MGVKEGVALSVGLALLVRLEDSEGVPCTETVALFVTEIDTLEDCVRLALAVPVPETVKLWEAVRECVDEAEEERLGDGVLVEEGVREREGLGVEVADGDQLLLAVPVPESVRLQDAVWERVDEVDDDRLGDVVLVEEGVWEREGLDVEVAEGDRLQQGPAAREAAVPGSERFMLRTRLLSEM